jgi:hypothetical protein
VVASEISRQHSALHLIALACSHTLTRRVLGGWACGMAAVHDLHVTHVCPVLARYRLNTRALDALQEFLEGPDEEEEEAPKSEEDKRKEAQEWHLHNFAK